MCIRQPTKKGIDKLPKEGTYYKLLRCNGEARYHDFTYHMGINHIPQKKQVWELATERQAKSKWKMGGHFYRYRKDAIDEERRGPISNILAVFRIKRDDIEYIGTTYDIPTITAHKARRIR
uniref:Uncharacterized protein n=1 Tax=viral metagenome TaxID=1070528 RepID=A0A6M3XFW8_9ZZZZ